MQKFRMNKVGGFLKWHVLYFENNIAEISDADVSLQDHAEQLAMEWLTGEEF